MNDLKKQIQHVLNLYQSNDLINAEILCKKLISFKPKVVILYNILGLIFSAQKKHDEAIQCYEEGIAIDPKYSMIYNNLGSIYKLRKNYIKAEDYYKKSISLDNKIAEPQNNLGNLYLVLNKPQEAIDCYKNAIKINTNFFAAYYNLGILYKNTGEFDNAKKYLESSLKINQNFYSGHRALSQVKKYNDKSEHLSLLKKIYLKKEKKDINKTEIAFALAKAHDDIKDFKNSIKYYNEGNKLRKKQIHFSKKEEKTEFDRIKKVFNKGFIKKKGQIGNPTTMPIFILGMPRSGTTLVEQIISSHTKVFGGDELNFFPRIIKKYFKEIDDVENIDKQLSKEIAFEYIENLKKISEGHEKTTDKLPINFKWIGHINLILPKSIIIHCVRNSKDNCLSIYKNYFTNPDLNFAYDVDDIIFFYNEYKNLMSHWKNLFPDRIYNISYETLVRHPEKEIRKLLKFCNLTWESNCLNFYKNKRIIKTASDIQARKKVYNTSIDSWKRYNKYLGNFFKSLKS